MVLKVRPQFRVVIIQLGRVYQTQIIIFMRILFLLLASCILCSQFKQLRAIHPVEFLPTGSLLVHLNCLVAKELCDIPTFFCILKCLTLRPHVLFVAVSERLVVPWGIFLRTLWHRWLIRAARCLREFTLVQGANIVFSCLDQHYFLDVERRVHVVLLDNVAVVVRVVGGVLQVRILLRAEF